MSKKRSVSTHFWNDNYIIDLDPIEKLLFLYLLTNDNTNMLGIYELHIRKISFDTGIDKDMILKIFQRFERAKKMYYKEGYVVLVNFAKNQSYNENMKKSALTDLSSIPQGVVNVHVVENIFNALEPLPKGFEGLPKGIDFFSNRAIPNLESESELEGESESESKKTNSIEKPKYDRPTLEQCRQIAEMSGHKPKYGEAYFHMRDADDWTKVRGKEGNLFPITNFRSDYMNCYNKGYLEKNSNEKDKSNSHGQKEETFNFVGIYKDPTL